MRSLAVNLFTQASPAKSVVVSALAHLLGIGLLGVLAMEGPRPLREAPGGQIVLVLQSEVHDGENDQQVLILPKELEESLLVLPDRARIGKRWFRQVPSDIELPQPKDSQVVPIPLDELSRDKAEKPRASQSPEMVAMNRPEADEIPRRSPSAITSPQEIQLPERQSSSVATPVKRPAKTNNYGDSPPQFSYQPSPVFPPDALANGQRGIVRVQFDIDLRGEVSNVKVKRSSGVRSLDAAAVTTIGTWRCIPRTVAGQPVTSTEVVAVHFGRQ